MAIKAALAHRYSRDELQRFGASRRDKEGQYRIPLDNLMLYVRFALFGAWIFYLALLTQHLAPEIPVPSVIGLTYPIVGPT
jgi:hypothetical protein